MLVCQCKVTWQSGRDCFRGNSVWSIAQYLCNTNQSLCLVTSMLAALATGAVDKIKDDQATAEPDGRFLSIFISIYSWCSGKNNDNLVIKKNFCNRIFTDHLLVFPIVLLSARRLSSRTRTRRWSPPWVLSIRPSSTTTLGRSAMSAISVSLCLLRILHKIQSEVNKGYPEI